MPLNALVFSNMASSFAPITYLFGKQHQATASAVALSAVSGFMKAPFCEASRLRGLPHVVGEVGGQPAVRPYREQHEFARGSSELRLDEPLGCLLWQIPIGNGEHLFRGRWPVFLDDGALDGDVL